jgi:hypothetical protein
MAGNLPIQVGSYPGLPLVPIREQALLEFGQAMDRRIAELEARFVRPRVHPAILFRESRLAPRRPR